MSYRPNRIGPWPLIDVDAAPVGKADTVIEGIVGTLASPSGFTNQSVRNESARSDTMLITGGDLNLGADEAVFMGVAIGGSPMVSRNTIISYAGATRFASDTDHCICTPFIGRTTETDDVFNCPNFSLVPCNQQTGKVGANTMDCNGSVIAGDFLPSGTEGTGSIVFGLWLQNIGAASVIEAWLGSMSIHRYLGDIQILDPNK